MILPSHIAGVTQQTNYHAVSFLTAPTGQPTPNPSTFRAPTDSGSGGTRLHIASLQMTVQRYYQKGLASATHKSYQTGQKRYLNFCSEAKRSAVPTSEETMLLFVTHLA